MARGAGDRGVSEVIGFILIFAFLVIAFTAYQGLVVPEQNRQVEFDHNRQVHNEFQDLRNAVLTSASTGTTQTAPITLGANYPERTLASNLGVSAGAVDTIEYGETPTLRIEHAVAVDPYAEVDDYWNGSAHAYRTKAVTYRPVYSFYSSAPETVYENSVVYNRFPDGANVTVAGQSLVDGRRISLVAVEGDLSAGGQEAVSVTTEPVSASTNRIGIEGDGQPLTISLPTQLSADAWEDLLVGEFVDDGGYVVDVRQVAPQRVAIDLEPDTTYELRVAKVGVGTGTTPEPAAYLTVQEPPGVTVINGSPYTVAVEARDRFNNPVAGETVTGTIDGGTFANGETSTTADTSVGGEVRFAFTTETDGEVSLEFSIEEGSNDYETVEFTLNAVEQPGDGDGPPGGGGNPPVCDFLPFFCD